MTTKQEIAHNIQKAIDEAERSKKWTAEKAGIALSTFHRKMNGGAEFTIEELMRIADVLNTRPVNLLPAVFSFEEAA